MEFTFNCSEGPEWIINMSYDAFLQVVRQILNDKSYEDVQSAYETLSEYSDWKVKWYQTEMHQRLQQAQADEEVERLLRGDF